MQSHQVPARKSQHFMCPLLAKYRKHGDRYIFKKEKLCMWCTFCGLYYLVHTVFIYCKFFAILILATRWIPSDLGLDPNPLKNGLDKWSNIILYFAQSRQFLQNTLKTNFELILQACKIVFLSCDEQSKNVLYFLRQST